ncbi:hypothetical protein FXO38_35797 [Capsicum annuum]|uniref:MADS-box domain-containing protein n=1 Tax=Capsicum annuum TaxID=4072 RepID=A0A2G2Z0Z6_CAPAN|nr:hypothetical protein FXO38_35797 [Capsicum annuum]KAF3633219.1 hypothetical protein FXO37_27149 [Capsicum annuum]PHT75545.1 hypothetical protein T459_19067 [Capsicum annuum]
MKVLDSEAARFVTFKKEIKCLIKKADKLLITTGTHVAFVTFSPYGIYAYDLSNNIDELIDNFLSHRKDQTTSTNVVALLHSSSGESNMMNNLNVIVDLNDDKASLDN